MNPYEHIEALISKARTLDEAAAALQILLSSDIAVLPDGRFYNIKVLVARFRGLRIEIHPKDHAPPHFHVICDSFNASFALSDCSLLEGGLSNRESSLIIKWFGNNRPLLVEAWNKSRPDDCQAGPVAE